MTVEHDATCTATLQTEWVSNDSQNRRVIGFDPGRVTPFCGVKISPQGQTIVHKFSRRHYYEKSHVRKNNEKIKKWNKHAEDVN
eukprot:625667-Hanusia_phi.AAC.2